MEPIRISVPTSLPIGDVNCYLLPGPEPALVDVGPRTPESRAALVEGLRGHGLALGDVRLIVITHGHLDHYGQAGDIQEETGAEVVVPEADRAVVEDYAKVRRAREDLYRRQFKASGLPRPRREDLERFLQSLSRLAAPARVQRPLRDGDRWEVPGWSFTVQRTPGHTAGSSILLNGAGLALVGDTLLRDITPNAAFGGADGHSVGMADYMDSLRRVATMGIRRVLPGHGEPFEDVDGFIKGYVQTYRSRREFILRYLTSGKPSAYDLVQVLFGDLPTQELSLGITEVLGHLEILLREGRATAEEVGGVLHYSAGDEKGVAGHPTG